MLAKLRLFTEGFMFALLLCAAWYIMAGQPEHGYTTDQRERLAVLAEMVGE